MILYLASNSKSRKRLLEEAKIKYKTVEQTYDEEKYEYKNKQINEIVLEIARNKMNCVNIEKIKEKEEFLILTSDSLHSTHEGIILGKPKNLSEAKKFIESVNGKASYGSTSICLGKYRKEGSQLINLIYHEETVETEINIYMTIKEINEYIAAMGEQLLNFSGGFSIFGIGAKFLHKINGSYSSVQGLPIVELKKAIHKMKK